MDYTNESYTRVYNRNTPELEFIGPDARSLLWHIQRCMDRSGVFEVGNLDPCIVVERFTGICRENVARDLPLLLDSGLLVQGDRALVDPTFVEAQNASKSNKHRQREFRDRRRSEKLSSPLEAMQEVGSRNDSLRVTEVTHGLRQAQDQAQDLGSGSGSEFSSSLSDPDRGRAREADLAPEVDPRFGEPPPHVLHELKPVRAIAPPAPKYDPQLPDTKAGLFAAKTWRQVTAKFWLAPSWEPPADFERLVADLEFSVAESGNTLESLIRCCLYRYAAENYERNVARAPALCWVFKGSRLSQSLHDGADLNPPEWQPVPHLEAAQ